jgi:hypothetical protein
MEQHVPTRQRWVLCMIDVSMIAVRVTSIYRSHWSGSR